LRYFPQTISHGIEDEIISGGAETQATPDIPPQKLRGRIGDERNLYSLHNIVAKLVKE
jgi:hypothetical protein